ncbi:hypothetical protein niasHT_000630 [Heterodera trifolii]|uniref:N-acyl-aliphatic-L-amino acid amidohydrolase n=1 Tax=Heterodera trifolii TaxID=157864 RepID=A0ABD2MBX5_9BILA
MQSAEETMALVAVTKFRDYLRINTEQPNPDYHKCRDFLFTYATELGFMPWKYECVPGKPMVGMTYAGSDQTLPSLLLYSHTDVVPTFPEHWTYPPYEAFKDIDGNIFGRGAQDMKCVGIQYMEALREILFENGQKPFLRTVHILWGPDEEIGSHDGMEKFVHTDKFRSLNIGFALDEGLASETDTYSVFYGERCAWWLKITCPGAPGHGSRFVENTAGPKLTSILANFNAFRERQRQLLLSDPNLRLGDVTSVNLTKIEGGVQTNVIPAQFVAYFDMRVTPTDDFQQMEAMIAKWCKEAGPDVTFEFVQKGMCKSLTPTDASSPWWHAFSSALSEEKCAFSKEIFIGGTDARFLREKGIPAIGFSPMNNTPILLHDHNEFLNEGVFLRGVKIYTKIIPRLANLPSF